MFKKFKFSIVVLAVLGIAIIGAISLVNTTQNSQPLLSVRKAVSKNPSLPFNDTNMCIVEEKNLNCSRLFTDSLLRKIVKKQNDNQPTIPDENVKAKGQVFFVELSFNKDTYIRNLSLPSINQNISPYASRKLTNLYMAPYISVLDTTAPSQTPQNVLYKDVTTQLQDKTQTTKAFLMKANVPLTFTIVGVGDMEELKVSFNILTLQNDIDLQLNTKITPLLSNNDKFSNESYLPMKDDLSFTTTKSVKQTRNNPIVSVDVDLFSLKTLKMSFFSEIILKDNVSFSTSSLSFLKEMWNAFFSDGYNNGIVPLNKSIEVLNLRGDFRFVPKDFLHLTNLKKLSIMNAQGLQDSPITLNDWITFFRSNSSLQELEITYSSLTDKSFDNIRQAIQSSSSTNLKLNLAHNELSTVPHFSNSQIITELNLKANALINISTFEIGYSKLKKVDLSFNGSLISKVPGFLRSLDKLASLDTLILQGLNIADTDVTQEDLTKPTNVTNLKQKLKELDLSNNNLSSLGEWFKNGNFRQLQIVNLSNNHLKKLPNDFWLSQTVNEKQLDLSNNPLLEINIPNASNVLMSIKLLNLYNTGKKVFASTLATATTLLKELKVGKDLYNSDYSFLLNIPNGIQKLEIRKAPSISSMSNQFKEKFAKFTALGELYITNSNLENSFLVVFNNLPSLRLLDLSGNNFTSLRDLKKAKGLALQKLVIQNNNRSTRIGLNINSLIWWIIESTPNLKNLDLKNSRLQISSNFKELTNSKTPMNLVVEISSPNSINIEKDGNFSMASIDSFLKEGVIYTVVTNTSDKNKVYINPITWLLNALKWDAMQVKDSEVNNYQEKHTLTDTKSYVQYKNYQLPRANKEELTNKQTFASYLNRANLVKTSYKANVKKFFANLTTINELERQQDKVKKDIEKLKKENSDFLKTINNLRSGTFFDTVMALISVVLAFNLIFAGVLIYKSWKKRKN